MKNTFAFILCFMLLFLISCESTPSLSEDTTTDIDTAETVETTEVSVRMFVDQMYQQALPPASSGDSSVPVAPGSLRPVEELSQVANGVVGSVVSLSLTDSPNLLFWMLQSHTDDAGMTLSIVTANGDATGHEGNFQPLCVVLDVTAGDGKAFSESPVRVVGTIRNVCFLDGNEYWFVNNGSAALMDITSADVPDSAVSFGGTRTSGEVWSCSHDGQLLAETLQGVYESIHTRFGVAQP